MKKNKKTTSKALEVNEKKGALKKKSSPVKVKKITKKKSSPSAKTGKTARRRNSRKKTRAEVLNQRLITAPRREIPGLTSIKVIGIGGAGGNIVSRMAQSERIRGVEFMAINTDAQDLDYAHAHKKIYIGKALTQGLGSGMNPEVGKRAMEENRSEVGEAIEGADIVFLTAGMGGGTGTGGISVIADIAREKGILTVAMVTRPFSFEGSERATIAQDGLNRLREKVDALVIVPNDRIFSIIDKETPIMKAFGYVDDVIKNGVKAISDLINVPGIINVDFADIKTSLQDAGTTIIGIGLASGQDRSIKAVDAAVNSPLFETAIDGAKNILFGIAGGRDFKMTEVGDIAKAVSANLDNNARVIFGAYNDKNLKDKCVKVTVIASGFSETFNACPLRSVPTLFTGPDTTGSDDSVIEDKNEEEIFEIEKDEVKKEEKTEPWDIPAFLRKKKKR